jgi:uncharacterized phosphosugar-binding protein
VKIHLTTAGKNPMAAPMACIERKKQLAFIALTAYWLVNQPKLSMF